MKRSKPQGSVEIRFVICNIVWFEWLFHAHIGRSFPFLFNRPIFRLLFQVRSGSGEGLPHKKLYKSLVWGFTDARCLPVGVEALKKIKHTEQAVREAATICPRPCKLTFDLLTLKVVSESRVTWATSVPILVFLGLSVLDLGPMYATDRRQTRIIA